MVLIFYLPIPYFFHWMPDTTYSQGKWSMFYSLSWQFEWVNTSLVIFRIFNIMCSPSLIFVSSGMLSCLSPFVKFASCFRKIIIKHASQHLESVLKHDYPGYTNIKIANWIQPQIYNTTSTLIVVHLIQVLSRFRVMMFHATFNNISVISWRSVLLVEETGVPGEKTLTCRKSMTNFIT